MISLLKWFLITKNGNIVAVANFGIKHTLHQNTSQNQTYLLLLLEDSLMNLDF